MSTLFFDKTIIAEPLPADCEAPRPGMQHFPAPLRAYLDGEPLSKVCPRRVTRNYVAICFKIRQYVSNSDHWHYWSVTPTLVNYWHRDTETRWTLIAQWRRHG